MCNRPLYAIFFTSLSLAACSKGVTKPAGEPVSAVPEPEITAPLETASPPSRIIATADRDLAAYKHLRILLDLDGACLQSENCEVPAGAHAVTIDHIYYGERRESGMNKFMHFLTFAMTGIYLDRPRGARELSCRLVLEFNANGGNEYRIGARINENVDPEFFVEETATQSIVSSGACE